MATKKLTAELEVETSKARQKVREVAETAAGAAGGEALPTRDLQELGKAAKETGMRLSSSGRMFAGLATGLARSAMAGGGGSPAANAAINGISSVAAGAAMGGLPGAIGAAVVTAISGLLDADVAKSAKMAADAKQKTANLDSMKEWEEARARTLAFKETLESLTSVETDLTERQTRLAEEIKKREEADADLARKMIRESDDPAAFRRAAAARQANAAELDQLRALEKQKPSSSGGGGADWNAVDALTGVGGMFAGSGAGARSVEDIAAHTAETVKVLKEIERNTDNGGGATWQ